MKIGLIGNGSWATALAKMLTDNGHNLHWWMRNTDAVQHLETKKYNKDYLSSVYFPSNIYPTTDLSALITTCDTILFCTPSAYIVDVLKQIPSNALQHKNCISAIKGIILDENCLLNDYLAQHFDLDSNNYVAITGPCHAEEVAQERLSYLTFSGTNMALVAQIATLFRCEYINTTLNADVWGTQYAAVLKNIYAIGAGIASGLGYGDNFLSVYTTNCFSEMHHFLQQHHLLKPCCKEQNFITSAYLGDLLVTCYSTHSRNRTFGTLVGKGYFARKADSEMNMVAEGYYAVEGMYNIIQKLKIELPIVTCLYQILREGSSAQETFNKLEQQFQ
jgi:glycerol-3-phosphate dehydrogenase (NAD(P)+)